MLLTLRRFPNWGYGHKWLTNFELERSNSELAYSSALAFKKLVGGVEAEILLARAMLLGRDAKSAKSLVDGAEHSSMNLRLRAQLLELKAAVQLFDGQLSAAVNSAKEIPPEQRSAEVNALLRHSKDSYGK